jgi:DnaJ-class molecular chaperone
MTDGFDTKTCTYCNGDGHIDCKCWPGDCICGDDYRECPICNGDGEVWIDVEADQVPEQ